MHLFGFITKKFVTMYGDTNVKFFELQFLFFGMEHFRIQFGP